MDSYKVDRICENMQKLQEDPYHLPILKGGSKDISLDIHALELLRLYYDGEITEDDIENFRKRG